MNRRHFLRAILATTALATGLAKTDLSFALEEVKPGGNGRITPEVITREAMALMKDHLELAGLMGDSAGRTEYAAYLRVRKPVPFVVHG